MHSAVNLLGLAALCAFVAGWVSADDAGAKFIAMPFNAAHGMVKSHDGDLLLSDTYKYYDNGKSAVYLVDSETSPFAKFDGQEVAGNSRTPHGYLVADFGKGRVYEVSKAFEVIREWTIEKPWNARMNADGEIYVVTYTSFFRLTDEGDAVPIVEGLNFPFDFAFDPSGRGVWISEQDQGEEGAVDLWSPVEGTQQWRRTLVSAYEWSNPESILEKDGVMYVAETALGEVIKLTPSGEASVICKNLDLPILIADNEDGRMSVFVNRSPVGPALVYISM